MLNLQRVKANFDIRTPATRAGMLEQIIINLSLINN